MEPIESVDLASVTREAEAEVMAERVGKVRAAVGGIVRDVAALKLERVEMERRLQSLDTKISKAEAKYIGLVKGDWSILNDNLFQSKPSTETG